MLISQSLTELESVTHFRQCDKLLFSKSSCNDNELLFIEKQCYPN